MSPSFHWIKGRNKARAHVYDSQYAIFLLYLAIKHEILVKIF